MRTLTPLSRLLVPVLALAGILAVGAIIVKSTSTDPLEEFAAGVDPEFRRLLVSADDAVFHARCRDLGEAYVTHQWFELTRLPLHGTPGAFDQLEPYIERFGRAYADIYDIRLTDHQLGALRRTPPEVLAEANRRATALGVLHADATVTDSAYISIITEDRAYAAECDLSWLTVLFDARLVRLEVGRGRREAAWYHLHRGLADARRVDNMIQVCQLLGMAYQMHMEEGRRDSAFHCLDLAEARARRSRSARQTSRILGFRAAEARDEGRFGAAHLHLLEAWRACEEYRGGGVAVRTLLNLADLYQDLDCWPAQEQILATIRTTVSLPPRFFDPGSRVYEDMRIAKFDMRSAFAHGDTARGLALMDSFAGVYGPRPYAEIYARLLHDRADILASIGRLEDAAAVSDQALAHVVRDHMANWEATLRVQQAAIALARADSAAARNALAIWRSLDGAGAVPAEPRTAAQAAALDVRTTSGADQVAALRRGLAAYQAAATGGDAGVSSYLRIADFDELRWIIHDLLVDDHALGLDFDMRWRRAGRPGARERCPGCRFLAGCNCPAGTPRELLVHWSRPEDEQPFSEAVREAGSDRGPAHALYVSGPHAVRRWWTDAQGTRSEVMDVTPEALTARIAALSRAVSLSRNDTVTHRDLAAELRDLGNLLLPVDQAVPVQRLLITADGALGHVPFGALDLQFEGPYRPLQDDVLVAFLRRTQPVPHRIASGVPLIVVGDSPLPELIRRRPDLGALPGAAREGTAVAEAWKGSRILSGTGATKHAMLAGLTGTSRLHVASHVVQDAATPYLSYIPLAAASGRIEDAMLEPRDILRADLAGCELVVLSGCSTGVPFVAGARQAPSFGAVFLDAGVTHAVQTMWDVDDDATAHVMAVFALRTTRPGNVWSYVEALREATMLLRMGPDALHHPFSWAAWTVTTTDPGF